jgi:transcriptional regulator with XRE-family HTH domain
MRTVAGVVPDWPLTDRLRRAREFAGLDQTTLAGELGLSTNTISNYERGFTTPKRPQLIAWAMATGVSLEWLEGKPLMRWSVLWRRLAWSVTRFATRSTLRTDDLELAA